MMKAFFSPMTDLAKIQLYAFALTVPLLTWPVLADDAPAKAPRVDATTDATSWSSGPYEYDGAGNIKQIGEDVYRYDEFGRLKDGEAATAASPQNRQVFAYDRHGNLLTVTTTITTPAGPATNVAGYAVNAATNQLDASTCASGATCRMGVYDDAGNQVGTTAGPGEFQWDALGMMTELDSHRGDRHERYIYDASDERIVVVANDGQGAEMARRYAIRGAANKVAREQMYIPSTGTWTAPRDYVHRGATLIASFSSASSGTPDRHYHADHLGSTRLLTDAAGQRLAAHTYWPYGQEASGSDVDAGRMKFTGHERDGSAAAGGLELDYMHARYYDPGVERFLSVDPAMNAGTMTHPLMWNRYSYVMNSPLNFTDPTGRVPCKITLTGSDARTAGVKSGTEVDGECIERKAPRRSIFSFSFPHMSYALERSAQKTRGGPPSKSTFTESQCASLFTVVQREARAGTQQAAVQSSNTWGDRTIGQFNVDFNTRGNPTLSDGGMMDIDWFTDISSYTQNITSAAPAAYVLGKSFWHAVGGTQGWPFQDSGEVTAMSYASRGASYNEIYNKACP